MIEILVSVAILASATVVIMQALARGSQALVVADHRLSAYAFAASKVADLELTLRADAPVTSQGQFRVGHDQFEWHVDAMPVSDEPALELVTLTIASQNDRPGSAASQVSVVRRIAAGE